MMISAKVIAHSNANGTHLLTIQTKAPKFLDAEMCRHRMLSQNSSSDRAIPLLKMLDSGYFLPNDVRLNQPGMQGDLLLDEDSKEEFWNDLKGLYGYTAEILKKWDKVHKQHLNRYLMGFSWQNKIITGTEWDNFFELRLHSAADPAMYELALRMKEVINKSEPTVEYDILLMKRMYGKYWHLPYINIYDYEDPLDIDTLLKISVARCARVSYNNHDGSKTSMQSDVKLANMLLKESHCFIEGTEVLTKDGFVDFREVTNTTEIASIDPKTLEFKKWTTPINIIKKKTNEDIFYYPNIGLGVTENHRMIGHIISNSKSRSEFTPTIYTPNEFASNKSSKKNKGLQEAKLPKHCNYQITNDKDYTLGKLIGFYIGDGFMVRSRTIFRLVKNRKIVYLKEILDDLNISYKIKQLDGDVTIANNMVYEFILEDINLGMLCGIGSANKHIPKMFIENLDILSGIFDGLKNSDGSVKRNTWVYTTISEKLKNDILSYSSLIGISTVDVTRKKNYRISIDTRNYFRVNDSRTKESQVEILKTENNVYCVSVPDGGLVVRTHKGKVIISGNCTPFEHQATPMEYGVVCPESHLGWEKGISHVDFSGEFWSGNFRGFVQYRKLLEHEKFLNQGI